MDGGVHLSTTLHKLIELVCIDSIFHGSYCFLFSWINSDLLPSMMSARYFTCLVSNTDFFVDRYSLCVLYIFKNYSRSLSSCDSVLECMVK